MKTKACFLLSVLSLSSAVWAESKQIRDFVWVWGNPNPSEAYELARDEPINTNDPARFAEANTLSRARILGVTNVYMGGDGLPLDFELADRLTREVSSLDRIVWEISPDHGKFERPFVFSQKVALITKLSKQYPKIEGVLLDDMSTVAIKKGLQPGDIATLRRELKEANSRLGLWGVVYTMNLNDAHLSSYVDQLDGVLLAVWHARDVTKIEESVAKARSLWGLKPVVLCLYLYDYGDERRMPKNLLELQCVTARKLLLEGKIQGIEFTLVTNDPEAVTWTRDWIARSSSDSVKTVD